MLTRLRSSPIVLGALLSSRAVLAQPAEAPAEKPAAPAQQPAAPAPPPEEEAPAAEEPPTEPEAPAAPAEPPAGAEPAPPPLPTGPLFTDPGADAAAIESLRRQQQAPATPEGGAGATDIYARDWWTYARPIIELHGYFRVRAELFHQFSLGRIDAPDAALWPRPPDDSFVDATGVPLGPDLCTPEEADTGSSDDPTNLVGCKNATQAGANLRLRLDPEIRISDNLRIAAQIDLLDNVVLGSTPRGYANGPAESGGYAVLERGGSDAVAFFDQTLSPPRSGVNSLSDSIHVKRAWAEYATPIGELRFGRMPHHWGLGMLYNAGDGIDDDFQSTIDRLQFVTSIKPLDLYVSASWDFPSEGAVTWRDEQGQAYDTAQLDDVDQWVFSVARLQSPELTRLALSRGNVVVNAGAQLTYRTQLLASDFSGTCTEEGTGAPALDCVPGSLGFTRRDATYWIPDIWLQVLYGGFRFEIEAATVQGVLGSTSVNQGPPQPRFDISQWGFAAEIEQRLVEDRLRLGFDFGWASGDPDVDGLTPQPGPTFGQLGDNTIETFRFNPSYRIDLILYRNILQRVQGTYYFRPHVAYDFMREATGQRIGGSVAAIWSRASEFIQAPGHERDLGVELNASLYFQSSDGALNDAPERTGGFFARLEYGVLFPMDGLGYPDGTAAEIRDTLGRSTATDLSNAQILRLFLGAAF